MSLLRGLLDVDGVLGDFHTPCIHIINELMGTSHKVEDFDDWDIFDALKVPTDVRKKVYDRMHEVGWCTNLGIYDGAVDGVRALREICDVYFVTSPMDSLTWEGERRRWVSKHFNVPRSTVLNASAKYVCAGDFLVDDKIDNLIKWQKGHPGGVPIRWIMPHLASHEWSGASARTWPELIEIVKNIQPGERRWQHPII